MLSFPVFPAPWMAPSPPTAATDPDAALEILMRDVIVPEEDAWVLANTFAGVDEAAEEEVRNPVRIKAVRSELESCSMGNVNPVG